MRRRTALETEIVIIGGGLAGLTLAASLGSAGLDVVCVERETPQRRNSAKFDGRTTALAAGPQQVLAACGVWQYLVKDACPILDIRVADQNHPPFLDFHSKEAGNTPFGWIIENRQLRIALEKRIRQLHKNVHLIAPAQMERMECREESLAEVYLNDGQLIRAQLVVGADGRKSDSRKQAGIDSYGWDYGQTAIVCTVKHTLPHANIAVEDFLPNGPLATLPMSNNRSSIVWSEKAETAKFLMALQEKKFTEELENRIGPWLGSIKLEGQRFAYPLNLVHAQKYIATRFALIAEAAHGIHPIAGQGLNLGMRDIATLNEELVSAARLGMDLGHPSILESYEQARKIDNGTMILGMDMLVRLFSNSIPPIRAARRFGLGLVENLSPARRFFMRAAMDGKKGISRAA